MDDKSKIFLEKSIVRIEDHRRTVLISHEEPTFRMSETLSRRLVWNIEYG